MRKNQYSWSQLDAKAKKPILFGQIKSELMSREELESENEPPQFIHYEPNILRMMESMGYDLANGPGLNFGKGRRTLLRSFVPKGKTPDYYHRTRRGLGYVSTPIPSASESEKLLYHNYSSGTSSGSQMLVLVTSLENFQYIWFQQAT